MNISRQRLVAAKTAIGKNPVSRFGDRCAGDSLEDVILYITGRVWGNISPNGQGGWLVYDCGVCRDAGCHACSE